MNTITTPDLQAQFDALGKLSWIWMHSPMHRDWVTSAAARFLLPPVAMQQFELLECDGLPVAYCSWAWLNEEAEIRYLLKPSALELADWNSGDRLWFIDWVAPFDGADSRKLKRLLALRFPNEVARTIHVKPGQDTAHIREFKGSALTRAEAEKKLRGYYGNLLDKLCEGVQEKQAKHLSALEV